jgi:hypothetical protein
MWTDPLIQRKQQKGHEIWHVECEGTSICQSYLRQWPEN